MQVSEFSAKVQRDGSITANWTTAGEATGFWLRYSTDGETWHVASTGTGERSTKVPAGVLPSGKLTLQLVAHDGFYSSRSKTVALAIPERAADIAILHPRDGYTYVEGQSLRLWGSAVGGDAGPVAPERCYLEAGRQGRRGEAWTSSSPRPRRERTNSCSRPRATVGGVRSRSGSRPRSRLPPRRSLRSGDRRPASGPQAGDGGSVDALPRPRSTSSSEPPVIGIVRHRARVFPPCSCPAGRSAVVRRADTGQRPSTVRHVVLAMSRRRRARWRVRAGDFDAARVAQRPRARGAHSPGTPREGHARSCGAGHRHAPTAGVRPDAALV